MKWIDSRIENPEMEYNTYYVIYLYCGIQFLGFANWVPNYGRTKGEWRETRCLNQNSHSSGAVLYWMPHPSLPELK